MLKVTPMTASECQARAEAYEEAAKHLLMIWTQSPEEITQGKQVSLYLQSEAAVWYLIARRLRNASKSPTPLG